MSDNDSKIVTGIATVSYTKKATFEINGKLNNWQQQKEEMETLLSGK